MCSAAQPRRPRLFPHRLDGQQLLGNPRTTHVLVFVVQLGGDSIPLLISEFKADYYIDEAAIRSAFQPPYQFNAIDTRSALKVDFWLLRAEPFENEVFARRLPVDLFGEPTWIATAEDVVLHKLYWNRLTPSDRQLSDVAGVTAVQGAGLDIAYLHRWAETLDVTQELEALLSGKIKTKSS